MLPREAIRRKAVAKVFRRAAIFTAHHRRRRSYERIVLWRHARLRRCFATTHTRRRRKISRPVRGVIRAESVHSALLARRRRVRSPCREAGSSPRLAFDVHAPWACLVEISLSTPRSKNAKPSTSRIPTNLVGSRRRTRNVELGPPSIKKAGEVTRRAAGVECPIRKLRAREGGESEANALERAPPRSEAHRRRRRRPLGNGGKVSPRRKPRPHANGRPAPAAPEPGGRSGARGPL